VNGSASYSDRSNVNLQGGIGIPIIGDTLAIRVAGLYDWNSLDGVRDIVSGKDESNRSYGGRVSVLFRPTSNLNFLLVHQQFRARNDILNALVSDPDAPVGRFGELTVADRTAASLGGTQQVTKGRGTILNATWDVGGNRLTYLGSYQDNDSNQTIDLNYANAPTPAYLDFVVPGLGNYEYQQYQNIRIKTRRLTNELRFERTGDHFWIYRFGLYFEDDKTRLDGVIDYTGANGGCRTTPGPLALLGLPCIDLGGGVEPKSHDRGYFTTQTFNITGRDTLVLGLRYSTSKTDNPPYDTSFHAWTGTASYKLEFNSALLAYATYGRSYRPGGFDSSGFNNSAGANAIPASLFYWKPEHSDTFEIGTKGEVLGNRLTYALSGYYQKFDNYINRTNNIACTGNPDGTGPLPGTVYTTSDGAAPNGSNACGNTGVVNLTYNANASVRGVELDMRGLIMRGWTGQITLAYADAHYDSALIPCNDYNGDGTPDQTGTPAVQKGKLVSLCRSSGALSSQPKFQATFNSEYTFALPDGFHAYVRGIGRYLGPATFANTGQKVASKFTVDGFAGVVTPVGVEIGMYLRNIFDRRVDTISTSQTYDLFGVASGYRTVTYGQRREFGLLARVNF
jgi:iron complex outermembrane receptor protein